MYTYIHICGLPQFAGVYTRTHCTPCIPTSAAATTVTTTTTTVGDTAHNAHACLCVLMIQ